MRLSPVVNPIKALPTNVNNDLTEIQTNAIF